MRRLLDVTTRLGVLALFAAGIGYFSQLPLYTPPVTGAAAAVVAVSFSHAGAPARDCRRLTPEELAALPANMRKPDDCPRQRVPVLLELSLDQGPAVSLLAPPSGLWSDGESHVYRKFVVPAGPHRLDLRMRDTPRTTGFDYEAGMELELPSGSIRVVDFDPQLDRFVLY